MKKRKWHYILLIVLMFAGFVGYRIYERLNSDTTAPEIAIASGMLEVKNLNDKNELLKGISAQDAHDGDVTDTLLVESMKYSGKDRKILVTYAAFDAASNVAKAVREVDYMNYEAPKFTLSKALVFSQNSSEDILKYISATDILDGDIQHRIRVTPLSKKSISEIGKHNVEFKVTNSLGDTEELVIPIETYAHGTYNTNVELSDYLIYLDKDSHFSAESYMEQMSCGADKISLKSISQEGLSVSIKDNVDVHTPGVYAVDYEVEYLSYRGISKLIVVVEG